MQLPALVATALTNSPAVVIEAYCSVVEGLFADGIEGAADGLDKLGTYATAVIFSSAEAAVGDDSLVFLQFVVACPAGDGIFVRLHDEPAVLCRTDRDSEVFS